MPAPRPGTSTSYRLARITALVVGSLVFLYACERSRSSMLSDVWGEVVLAAGLGIAGIAAAWFEITLNNRAAELEAAETGETGEFLLESEDRTVRARIAPSGNLVFHGRETEGIAAGHEWSWTFRPGTFPAIRAALGGGTEDLVLLLEHIVPQLDQHSRRDPGAWLRAQGIPATYREKGDNPSQTTRKLPILKRGLPRGIGHGEQRLARTPAEREGVRSALSSGRRPSPSPSGADHAEPALSAPMSAVRGSRSSASARTAHVAAPADEPEIGLVGSLSARLRTSMRRSASDEQASHAPDSDEHGERGHSIATRFDQARSLFARVLPNRDTDLDDEFDDDYEDDEYDEDDYDNPADSADLDYDEPVRRDRRTHTSSDRRTPAQSDGLGSRRRPTTESVPPHSGPIASGHRPPAEPAWPTPNRRTPPTHDAADSARNHRESTRGQRTSGEPASMPDRRIPPTRNTPQPGTTHREHDEFDRSDRATHGRRAPDTPTRPASNRRTPITDDGADSAPNHRESTRGQRTSGEPPAIPGRRIPPTRNTPQPGPTHREHDEFDRPTPNTRGRRSVDESHRPAMPARSASAASNPYVQNASDRSPRSDRHAGTTPDRSDPATRYSPTPGRPASPAAGRSTSGNTRRPVPPDPDPYAPSTVDRPDPMRGGRRPPNSSDRSPAVPGRPAREEYAPRADPASAPQRIRNGRSAHSVPEPAESHPRQRRSRTSPDHVPARHFIEDDPDPSGSDYATHYDDRPRSRHNW